MLVQRGQGGGGRSEGAALSLRADHGADGGDEGALVQMGADKQAKGA
jgi:hypothetical protein